MTCCFQLNLHDVSLVSSGPNPTSWDVVTQLIWASRSRSRFMEAMVLGYEIAPVLSTQSEGKVVCVVGTPVCMDHHSGRHCLATVPQGERFYFEGALDQSKASYTILKATVQQKQPIPVLMGN